MSISKRTRAGRELAKIADEAASCTNCNLYRDATQTVFGEGPVPAPLMIIGEQPGDQEDRKGRPFVGPGGRMLDRALEAAGLDRDRVYITNAVKHFKWTARGKRRIHKRPNSEEMAACKPWLEREIEHVQPDALIAMGVTAVKTLFGSGATISRLRGSVQKSERIGPTLPTIVTVHPASIVRLQERDERHAELDALVKDLKMAAREAGVGRKGKGRH